ncbi:MAG: tetratricopeptide repeat protein [Sediminibacterium sp.]|nr:tetratricopeptide repeat protein [Sediminibacterium sp.]
MVAAIMVLAAACHRATVPAATNVNTPIINNEIRNESGQIILAGHASISAMQMPNYKTWFDDSYSKYTVDATTTGQLKPLLQNKRMEIFLGSWCGDSKREVPRMIKVLQNAGMDTTKLSLIFVDNSPNAYKQSPQHEEQGKNIHHVPSFIIYDEHKEVGRIIESPVTSLEKDLLAILQQQSYQPNYHAIDHWTKQVTARNRNMSDAELQSQVATLKPLCRHYGEFNGYGYVLLAAKNTAEALNVFRLNTMIYPDNANVFDSLAEAWEKAGNKKEAITAYEKVLVLKPGDEKAKGKIVALQK